MTQSGKLINSGLALVLISSSGCAGNGLRNMFSRNDTAGYKTLEELEEERLAAEQNSDDESGPRFASWLPFGKKNAEETEAIAAADEVQEESEETQKSAWWKNPFRRQETIEADPFLENELPTEVVVAEKDKARAKAEEVVTAAKTKTTKDVAAVKDQAVKAVSATTASEITEEDDLLVEKFEKHFEQTTESAVESADESSDVLVSGVEDAAAGAVASGKKAKESAQSGNSAADRKLAEFEELLAAKKAAALKARREVQFDEELESAENAADDFAESVAESSKSAENQSRTSGKQAEASVDEFDSLFEPVEKPVVAKKRKIGSTHSPSAQSEVEVARADDIFGTEAVSGDDRGHSTKKGSSTGGWKGEEPASKFTSADAAGKTDSDQQSELARKVIDNTVDQFAAMFSGSRASNGAPRASAPDADEWTAASQGKPGAGGLRGVPVRTASNGRELGAALDSPAGLKDDGFFTGSGNPPLVTNLQAVPEGDMNGPMLSVPAAPVIREAANSKAPSKSVQLTSAFSFRNIVLVIGGLIVAALLFAPGRKKPTEASQLPAQG